MWNQNRCLLNFLSAESSAITQRYISLLISLKIEMQKNTLKMIIYGAYIKWRTFDASAENWICKSYCAMRWFKRKMNCDMKNKAAERILVWKSSLKSICDATKYSSIMYLRFQQKSHYVDVVIVIKWCYSSYFPPFTPNHF